MSEDCTCVACGKQDRTGEHRAWLNFVFVCNDCWRHLVDMMTGQQTAAIQQAADLKASLADYENTMMVIIEMTSGSLQRRIATEVDKAMERKDRALAAADRKTDGSEREGG